jgi:hypothetical protein
MADKQKSAPLPEWVRDAIAAEPPGFMQDIVQASRLRSNSASMIPQAHRSENVPRPASAATAPIRPPQGIDIIDRMCIEQDRADRAAAIRQRVETRLIEKLIDDEARGKTR